MIAAPHALWASDMGPQCLCRWHGAQPEADPNLKARWTCDVVVACYNVTRAEPEPAPEPEFDSVSDSDSAELNLTRNFTGFKLSLAVNLKPDCNFKSELKIKFKLNPSQPEARLARKIERRLKVNGARRHSGCHCHCLPAPP